MTERPSPTLQPGEILLDLDPDLPPFDRQPGESGRQFEAFTAYRNLGPQRSLNAAYRSDRTAAGKAPDPLQAAPGGWRTWYRTNRWPARAEAYDAHLELLNRKGQEAEHAQHIEDYRDRQRKLGSALVENAVRLLKLTNERLAGLKSGDIPLERLPSFLRAAASAAEAGANAEAQAIAVTELLSLLQPPPVEPLDRA